MFNSDNNEICSLFLNKRAKTSFLYISLLYLNFYKYHSQIWYVIKDNEVMTILLLPSLLIPEMYLHYLFPICLLPD